MLVLSYAARPVFHYSNSSNRVFLGPKDSPPNALIHLPKECSRRRQLSYDPSFHSLFLPKMSLGVVTPWEIALVVVFVVAACCAVYICSEL